MNELFKTIKKHYAEISHLSSALSLLTWDQETYMPENGIGARAEQIALLSGLLHDRLADKTLGKQLNKLIKKEADLTKNDYICITHWLSDYEKSIKLPRNYIEESCKAESMAHNAWVKARQASDFALFAPHLKKLIVLRKKYVDLIGYKKHPYDTLLDDYEPNMTEETLTPIISNLKDTLIPIIKKINQCPKDPIGQLLNQKFSIDGQKQLSAFIKPIIGLADHSSRLDEAAHPFSIGIGHQDNRITTRYQKIGLESLHSVLHECGHALYDANLPHKHFATPLADSTSLGIHESQSRFWENQIGRSLDFCYFILPHLKKYFSPQFKGITAKQLYRAFNHVVCTSNRVQSDEVTYNLHIAIRYELELALFENRLSVNKLPNAWNELTEKYLGFYPKNDNEGILQDMHWGSGAFGYFPTYTLGNLFAAQWYEQIQVDIPEINQHIRHGKLDEILAWHRKHIHQHGRKYSSNQLSKRICKHELNANAFIHYIKNKYSNIYNITL